MPNLNDSDGNDENEFVSRINRAELERPMSVREATYELEKFSKNLLIIFSHLNFLGPYNRRFGTHKDVRLLQKTFLELHFECSIYEDLCKHELLKTMEKYGEKDFTDYGCVFVAIMTRGDYNSLLHAYDYKYSEYDLIKCITRNPTLNGKPVVFLIQASRGIGDSDKEISGNIIRDEKFDDQLKSDILLFYSSPIGLPSFRSHDGSFFIQSVCKQIHLLADKEDFGTICKAVMIEFALDLKARVLVDGRPKIFKQKPVLMSMLTRRLYLVSKQDFSACGCVCVAVLTHGSAHGFLEACDVGYSERALFAAFDALANRSLAGKPIVFLIEASRGAKPAGRICVPRLDEIPDSSIQLDAAGGSQDTYQIKYLPTEANMIIFHSCFEGRAVPKDDRSGSCFVQTLCEQVLRHGASVHLEKLFRRVRRLVAETSPQMPVTSSTLLKKLFLQRNNPDSLNREKAMEQTKV